MTEPIATSINPAIADSVLNETKKEPKGVLPKNLKPGLYLCAAGLVIAAAFFSGTGKKASTKQGTASHQASQPLLQDNTDNNAQELRSAAAAAEQKMAQQGTGMPEPSLQNATPAQQAVAAAYGPNGQPIPCVPGQPCAAQQQQISPAAQAEQQLAAKTANWLMIRGLHPTWYIRERPTSLPQDHRLLPWQIAQAQSARSRAPPQFSPLRNKARAV
jgi:type IV secretion system protein VirB10